MNRYNSAEHVSTTWIGPHYKKWVESHVDYDATHYCVENGLDDKVMTELRLWQLAGFP